ncbi:MAG: prepilin-type N-terminal cleavage/methylation domain-containing protein [Gammaproteobacteria bacterium]|nr:prepilin-type N-terminal cleavage/methylation domain-containing protein [Gammaproteobacteria bacterium]
MYLPTVQAKSMRGFTLLETMVAFVLLSLALALIFQIFSTGLRSGSAAEQRVAAAIVADGIMASLEDRWPLEIGERSGEEGPFSWHLEVQSADVQTDETLPTAGAALSHRLLRVDLQLRWLHGNREQWLEMSTLRLGRADG